MWVENWLNEWAQRVVVRGTKSSWRPVVSSILQRLVLGPVLFNIFINDLDNEAECTFSKFTDDPNLAEWLIQQRLFYFKRYVNRLETWIDRNLIKFKEKNYGVLQLETNKSRHQQLLGITWLEGSFVEEDLAVSVQIEHESAVCPAKGPPR